MHPLIEHVLSVFFAFFAIMNPIANAPIFIGLTADQSQKARNKTALRSVAVAFAIVVVFTLLGKAIFSLFGLTMPAFRITGGVLVALIGYQMLHGRNSRVHHPNPQTDPGTTQDDDDAPDIAISPLAIPILAGPGTIATAMNFASTGTTPEYAVTIGAFAALCAMTYTCFRLSEKLGRLLGTAGFAVVTRLMGLIVASIGVQMLITGTAGAIKSFG